MNDLLQLNTLSTNNNHNNTNNNNNNNKNLINPPLIQTNNTVIRKVDRLNKRPLTTSTIDLNTCTKRIKGSLGGNVQQQHHQMSSPQPLLHHQYHQSSHQQSAPQLLQQLMAPTPQVSRSRAKANCAGGGAGTNSKQIDTAKWDMENTSQNQICGLNVQQQQQLLQNQQQQQAASNSVLKNLLVSGCDISAGYICIVPMRSKKALKT